MPVLHTSAAWFRRALVALPLVAVAACGDRQPVDPLIEVRRGPPATAEIPAMYRSFLDGEFVVPAIPARYLNEENRRQVVNYWTDERPGTIIIDPYDKFLYYVLEGDRAIRYRIGVGEDGRKFTGRATIRRKSEWPSWTPTANMLREDPELYGPHQHGMPGGLENPLGARALYLYRNGRDTMYRIHGTYAPWSIGQAISAGCIRLFNQDVIDLYERVDTGTRVVVLGEHEAGRGTVPAAGS